MLKISAVSQGSIVLHRALRTLSSLRRSQHEIKSCSFWIHTNNSALNLFQQLFTHTAVKVCFTPPCFPRPWKTSWSPQTASQQAGNHYHRSSFLDLRSKVLYTVTQENGVFSSNSAAFGSRSIKWSPWLFFPSELLWGNSLAQITWEWPSSMCTKLCFLTADTKNKKGNKATLESGLHAWCHLHWNWEHGQQHLTSWKLQHGSKGCEKGLLKPLDTTNEFCQKTNTFSRYLVTDWATLRSIFQVKHPHEEPQRSNSQQGSLT